MEFTITTDKEWSEIIVSGMTILPWVYIGLCSDAVGALGWASAPSDAW